MAKKSTSARTPDGRPWMSVSPPTRRALQVYAVDPSAGRYAGNHMTLHVPWEKLAPGPVGHKVAVVDYDPVHKRYYTPVDLDHPYLLARHGFDPSESDPRFHQQMVYAVASQVIEMFEVALGRSIHWRRADFGADPKRDHFEWWKTGSIEVLNLYPHAMQQANAYYSPEAKGILFGYFTANTSNQGSNLPGQRVFTCLSHDIVAHEVTHAVIDGIRTYFTEPTNPDVLAFHEGFADLCALFSHFTHKEALLEAIRRTGGRLYDADFAPTAPTGPAGGGEANATQARKNLFESRDTNPLVQLALQFGQARGAERGLRSALRTNPDPADMQRNVNDPHFRGSILVAAVFDAFFEVYMRRAGELLRIHRAGGAAPSDDLPDLLAEHLARHAADTAAFFFKLCARALDYCPPVDLTFGDFLRALITVSRAIKPEDDTGIRTALMQSFRLRGIYPDSASFFSEDALCWPLCPKGSLPPLGDIPIEHPETKKEQRMSLVFGSPNGLTALEKNINGAVLRKYATLHRKELGLDPALPVSVPSFHPMFRTLGNGRLHVEMVVEVMQLRPASFDPAVSGAGSFPFRGGVTLIIAAPELAIENGRTVACAPEVALVISKPIAGHEGTRRESSQRDFALSLGLAAGNLDEPRHFQADFGLLHEER